MRVAGIDYSSRFVDVVTVPCEGTGAPVWRSYPLEGCDAFDRARNVAHVMPGRAHSFWDGILAVAIEHPAGKVGTGHMLRIQGAVLACIPARMLVHPLPPAKWKRLSGCRTGAANHAAYSRHSAALLEQQGWTPWDTAQWPHDAHAAHLMALALRALLDAQEQAA